eukprot:5087491-Amphidinium_carterae.1
MSIGSSTSEPLVGSRKGVARAYCKAKAGYSGSIPISNFVSNSLLRVTAQLYQQKKRCRPS